MSTATEVEEVKEVAYQIHPGMSSVMYRNDPFVLVEGPAGTSKTNSDLKMLVIAALQNPGAHIAIVRKTRTSLTSSVLKTLEDEVFPALGLQTPGNAKREGRFSYHVPGGSELVPVGVDQPERLFSTKWDKICCFEATELSKDEIQSLYRGLRGEAIRLPNGKPFRQLICEVNPTVPNNCLNAEFAEPASDDLRRVYTEDDYQRLQDHNWADPPPGKWKRVITKHFDNPGYFNLDAWKWTDSGADYLQKLEALTGHWRARMLDGLWRVQSGTVFPEYDPDVHLCDDFEPPAEWPQVQGYDPGRSHPTAILWVCRAPDNGIFVYDGIHRGGLTVHEHLDEVTKREEEFKRNVLKRYADPQQFFSSTASGSCDSQARAHPRKYNFIRWPRTISSQVLSRVNAVSQLLINAMRKKAGVLQDGLPYLMICRRCVGLQNNLSEWMVKRTASGDLPTGDDQFVDANNDATDVLMGIISTGFLQRACAQAA